MANGNSRINNYAMSVPLKSLKNKERFKGPSPEDRKLILPEKQ